MHIVVKPHTCMHAYSAHGHEYPNTLGCLCVCVCVWERLGSQQEMTEVRVLKLMKKRPKREEQKIYCSMKTRPQIHEKIFLTAAQTEVEVIRHSWRHPQSSISCSVPCTTWKLISFGGAAKQSQQPHQKVFNDRLSQSGNRGNEVL